jgi:predicted DsbA family dithiol-disulfide isomerase
VLAAAEPGLPYAYWRAPESAWPVTSWPAFEAIRCARRQSLELADDLAWAIRVALFAESRCISMRHELLALATKVGAEMDRFEADFDNGAAKREVIAEARDGWEHLRVDGSPTFVLPTGEQIASPGLPNLQYDAAAARVDAVSAAPCTGVGCLDLYRGFLRRAAGDSS